MIPNPLPSIAGILDYRYSQNPQTTTYIQDGAALAEGVDVLCEQEVGTEYDIYDLDVEIRGEAAYTTANMAVSSLGAACVNVHVGVNRDSSADDIQTFLCDMLVRDGSVQAIGPDNLASTGIAGYRGVLNYATQFTLLLQKSTSGIAVCRNDIFTERINLARGMRKKYTALVRVSIPNTIMADVAWSVSFIVRNAKNFP